MISILAKYRTAAASPRAWAVRYCDDQIRLLNSLDPAELLIEFSKYTNEFEKIG